MHIRTITYEDFNGDSRTEEFMFNMNKAETFQWLSCNGGYTLDKLLIQLQKDSKVKDIMEVFEDLILRAYGEVSVDGRCFNKSDEISRNFKATNAYSTLFVELVTDPKKAAAFMDGIFPKDMIVDIEEIVRQNPDGIPDEMKDYLLGKTDKAPDNVVPMA